MTYRAPLWARAFLALDRLSVRAENLRDGLRDELFLAWIRPEDRAALTATMYADQETYLPGGRRFRSGLFGWERRVLDDAALFPRSGRVLVGAAGAGREMAALIERGYEAVAFDPCGPFVDAARALTAGAGARATAVCASYADLVRAAGEGGGPLDFLRGGPPFDAVLLGWGSLSHVMPASERVALLRAVRALAPRGPVLASFAIEPVQPGAPAGKGRVRDGLRRLFATLGAPGASERGDHFVPNGGFFSCLGEGEITALAEATGYRVALFEEAPYPHAVLVPAVTT